MRVLAWQLDVCCPTLVFLPKYVHQLSTTHQRSGHNEIPLKHAPHSVLGSLALRPSVSKRIREVLVEGFWL